ncbi:MAG TPA: response regulator [Halioglobus sp.]|jgi:two-component system chemotaxis response regulator CheY
MKIILVADDAPVIRKVARRLLQDMGFVVVEAETGDEVVAFCRDNMPDAVLLDYDMPGMKSIDVIGEIAQMQNAGMCKVLYCTSELLIPEMTRAKRAGASGFMLKPFNRKILSLKLSESGIQLAA